jgi:hypothetical protein
VVEAKFRTSLVLDLLIHLYTHDQLLIICFLLIVLPISGACEFVSWFRLIRRFDSDMRRWFDSDMRGWFDSDMRGWFGSDMRGWFGSWIVRWFGHGAVWRFYRYIDGWLVWRRSPTEGDLQVVGYTVPRL